MSWISISVPSWNYS